MYLANRQMKFVYDLVGICWGSPHDHSDDGTHECRCYARREAEDGVAAETREGQLAHDTDPWSAGG